jgi:predicted alpha/beta superfamily hydrolase
MTNRIWLFALIWLAACQAEPELDTPPSHFEAFNYTDSKYITEKSGNVYLPPSYFSDTTKSYPVLYLMDQQNMFFDSLAYGGTAWKIQRTTDSLSLIGELPELILVGVNHASEKRFLEYLPQQPMENLPADLQQELVETVGSMPFSDAYLQFLTQELKPFIDRRYRTKANMKNTYIAGSSMGGLISMYAVCEYPEVFQGALCLSTHWPVSLEDDTPEAAAAIIDYFSENVPKGKRWYFDYGTKGLDQYYAPYQQRVDAIMKANGYTMAQDWLTQLFPGHDHSERYWGARVHLGLRGIIR